MMSNAPERRDCVVIIPMYNERENAAAVIDAVLALEHGFDVLVIDDNSPAEGYSYVFEMDADFSHNPADLERLRRACAEEGADVAVGSRYLTGVNVVNWPMGRVLMSYYASKYVRIVTGLPVHDTTAGFVCYRRRVLEAFDLDAIRFKGYAFQIEMKFTAHKMGFRVVEVPIVFVNRVLGTSKMNSSIFGEAVFGVIRLKLNSIFHKYPRRDSGILHKK